MRRKSADPLVDALFAQRLRAQQTAIGFAENDFHRDRFGARIITGVRIRVEVDLFVIGVAQPVQGFFADARPGYGRAKQADNGGALGATETRIAPGYDIGSNAALPVGRSRQGDQAPFAGNEVFDFDGITDGEDIGIAGAHLVVDANAAAFTECPVRPFLPAWCRGARRERESRRQPDKWRRIGFARRWRHCRPV